MQIAALVYGVYVVAGIAPGRTWRSTADRIEIVTARDISDGELAAARDPRTGRLPVTGPRFVSVDVPAADRNDALFEQALSGNEEHVRPKFYVPYEVAAATRILAHAQTARRTRDEAPASKPLIEAAMREVSIPAGARCAGCRCSIARDSGRR